MIRHLFSNRRCLERKRFRAVRMLLRLGIVCCSVAKVSRAADLDLSGTVYDRTGKPVFGAKVELALARISTISAPDGSWFLVGKVGDSITTGDSIRVEWHGSSVLTKHVQSPSQKGIALVLAGVDAPSIGVAAPMAPKAPVSGFAEVPPPFAGMQAAAPVQDNRKLAEQYQKMAASSRSFGKGTLIGGLAAAAIGGIIVANSFDAQGDAGISIAFGAPICGLGALFALMSPIPFFQARDFEDQAAKYRDLWRREQGDRPVGPSSTSPARRGDIAVRGGASADF